MKLDFYEWVEKWKPYREWLVPATWLNRLCTVQVLEAKLDQEDKEFLRQQLVKWRAFWTQQKVPPDEVERRLADIENDVRAFRGEEEGGNDQ